MTWLQAILLGALQGLTEFLPVSSSGHLAMAEYFLGLQSVPLTFDILLHLGTLASVAVYFRNQLKSLTRNMLLKIGLATLPLVVAGAMIKPVVEAVRHDMSVLVVTYAVGATLLLLTDIILKASKDTWIAQTLQKVHRLSTGQVQPSYLQSFLIGIFQVLATLPGISRSGSTLSGGILTGVPRQDAFTFAFLISIPAVLGATTLDLYTLASEPNWQLLPWSTYGLGVIVSGLVGWVALHVLAWFVQQQRIWPFALYCATVSILLFLFV
jgi:undecaprenyl-diphosphatase